MSPTRRSAGPEVVKIETLEAAALREETMIHFREIVVFRRQPENRDGVHAALGQFARHMNGRERLVNAVRGAAKQSDLLACHHSDCAVAQPVQISRGRFVRAKRSILVSQNFHDGAANGVLEPNLADGIVDSICGWGMAVKFGDAGKIGKKCGIEVAWFQAIRPVRSNYTPSGVPSLCPHSKPAWHDRKTHWMTWNSFGFRL